jgi:hypothetical protein
VLSAFQPSRTESDPAIWSFFLVSRHTPSVVIYNIQFGNTLSGLVVADSPSPLKRASIICYEQHAATAKHARDPR